MAMTGAVQKSDLDSICRRLRGEFDTQGLTPRMEQLLRELDARVLATVAGQPSKPDASLRLRSVDHAAVKALKGAVKALWQMENGLRASDWSTHGLAKEKAQHHLGEARSRLNKMLNEADPIPTIVDQPPVLSDD